MITLIFLLSTLPLAVSSIATEFTTVFEGAGGMAIFIIVELPAHFGVVKTAAATGGCASLIVILSEIVSLVLWV